MSSADDTDFFRRVGAILVAEVDDPNALAMGLEILRGPGDAEPLSSNAVVAVFDDPIEAVTAATRLHVHTAGATGRSTWRAGLAVGDVPMASDGTATRAAIDRATALSRAARPGTTAVTSSALPLLGGLRDALLEPLGQRVADDPVHLLVPRGPTTDAARRRTLALLAGAAAIGGVAGVAWIAFDQSRRRSGRHLILGVELFRSSGEGEAPAWMGPALRDGLNTHLSELAGVKVYSDEFIDFLTNRENATAIEVASRLGVEKMVSGTVLVVGDAVRIEARIIDVATGMFEGAYATSGRPQDFLALERSLVSGVIGKLHLDLSPDEERRLAEQHTTNLEALQRVLDVEQESRPLPESPGEAAPGPSDPHSSPWRWLEPRAAHAEDDEAAIAVFLEQYRQATEARDVTRLATMYVAFSDGQRAALERFFSNVQNLRVKIERIETAVVGEDAVVTYTRIDDFIDIPTDEPQHVSVRLTRRLRRIDGRWRFGR